MMRSFIAAFVSLYFVCTAQAQTFVQKAINGDFSGSGVTTLSVTVSALTTGNLVAATVRSSDNSLGNCGVAAGVQVTLTDANNTYKAIDAFSHAAQSTCLFTFYLENITGGATSITATFTRTPAFVGLEIQEWSGLVTTSALDVHNVGASSGTTVTSPSVTPGQNGELIYGTATEDDGGTCTPTSGSFTIRNTDANGQLFDESAVQGTAGAITASFTCSGSITAAVGIATFKPAAAATCPKTLALMGVGC